MNFPTNLKYTEDHEWVRVEGQFAYIGITEFAQRELGDIVFVDIPTAGKTISQGDPFGTVEAVKTVSDLFMPVSGEIVAINEELEATPELVNTDPYDDGWMVKITLKEPAQVNQLLSADQYKAKIAE